MAGIYDVGALRKAAEANGFKGTDEELILETARLNERDPADLARYLGYDRGGKWGNRLGASVDSYQANMYGLGEAITGSDWMRRGRVENEAAAGLQRELARSQGAISSYKDVDSFGDGLDYLGGLAVDSLPYAGEALLGGLGAARLAGRGLQAAIQGGRAADASVDAVRAGQAAERALALRSTAGGVAASYPSAVGDILSNQREASPDGSVDLLSAFAGGVPYAALNAIGIEGALARRSLARGVGEGGAISRFGKSVGRGMATEGASETGQEMVNQGFGRMAVDPNAGLFDPDALERYGESFVGGAALGGAFGSVGGWRQSQGAVNQQRLQGAADRDWAAVELAEKQRAMDLLSTSEPGTAYGQQPLPGFGLDTANPLDNTEAQQRSYEDLRRERNALRQERLALLRDARDADPSDTARQSALLQADIALRQRAEALDALLAPFERAEAGSGQMSLFGGAQDARAGQSPEEFFATGLPTFEQPAPTPDAPSFTDFYGGRPDTAVSPYDDIVGGGIARVHRENIDLPREVQRQRQDEAQRRYEAKRADAFNTFEAMTPEDQKRVRQPAIDALAAVRELVDSGRIDVTEGDASIGELRGAVQAGDNKTINRILKEAKDRASQQPVVPGAAGVPGGTVAGEGDQPGRGAGAARPVAGSGPTGQPAGAPVAGAGSAADAAVANTGPVGAAKPAELTDDEILALAEASRPIEEKRKTTVKRRDQSSADLDQFLVDAYEKGVAVGKPLTLDQMAAAAMERGFTNKQGKPISRQSIAARLEENGIKLNDANQTALDLDTVDQSELVGEVSGEDADTTLGGAGFRAASSAADTAQDELGTSGGFSTTVVDEDGRPTRDADAAERAAKKAERLSSIVGQIIGAKTVDQLDKAAKRFRAPNSGFSESEVAQLEEMLAGAEVAVRSGQAKLNDDLGEARATLGEEESPEEGRQRVLRAAKEVVQQDLRLLNNDAITQYWAPVASLWDENRSAGQPVFAQLPGAAKLRWMSTLAHVDETSPTELAAAVEEFENELAKVNFADKAFKPISEAAERSFRAAGAVLREGRRNPAPNAVGDRPTDDVGSREEAPADGALPVVGDGTRAQGVKIERKPAVPKSAAQPAPKDYSYLGDATVEEDVKVGDSVGKMVLPAADELRRLDKLESDLNSIISCVRGAGK